MKKLIFVLGLLISIVSYSEEKSAKFVLLLDILLGYDALNCS